MNPFHCSNCNKLLGMVEGNAEIKCPRCKTMNYTILSERVAEALRNSLVHTDEDLESIRKQIENKMIGKDDKGNEYPIPGARIPVDYIDYKLYPPGVVPVERISRDEIKKRYK